MTFDRTRRTVGLFAGPAAFLLVLLIPSDLPVEAHRLAAVFALVIVFWISEAIPLPVTALLGPTLLVPLGVATPKEAFAAFGNPIILLFLGSFLIAGGMKAQGLDRRIALFVLSRPWVGERPERILLAFGAVGALLSMWMSNTATTAMMLPIGLRVISTLSSERKVTEWPYATGLLLMIAFSCNIGGIATPVGSPPNLIAIGLIESIQGTEISFFGWMIVALPIALLLFGFLYVLIAWMYDARSVRLDGAGDAIRAERATLTAWSNGERVALLTFLTAVLLWILPGIVSILLGGDHTLSVGLKKSLPAAPVAILAASLLFLIPIDWKARRFALDWKQAVQIDWGTIMLFGGGLSLGSLAFSTGLAGALGTYVESTAGGLAFWAVVLLAILVADFATEVMSNTATANLLIPILLALGASLSGPAHLPALGAALGCSLAFCLPVATPPNAIVYGSGLVPLPRMVRTGILLDIGCGVIAWAGLMVASGWL